MMINNYEKQVLRELAKRVAELASRPEENLKRELWYKHNSLLETRPLIFCDPENGWAEIIKTSDLKCVNKLLRTWENVLRKEIFWGESMGDDRVIEPFFNVSHVYEKSDWGMQEVKTGGVSGGSFRWDAPLKDYSDFEKLCFPQIIVDYEKTNEELQLAKEIFGDVLTVRLKTSWWWTLGLTQTLIFLRGLEQFMYDMYDYPEELHRLMSFLRDGHMAELDYLEESGLLSLNNNGTYIGSGGFGYTNELSQEGYNSEKIHTIDMWGFAESQETTGVSPELFKEFVFPYQKPILERFGLNCYGCCEALNSRWDIVSQLPRIRRVSVSPWADLGDMAEKLGSNYVYSMKPIPTDIAVPSIDEHHIRKGLRNAMKITRNCRVEVIMKDNNTLGGNPQNAIRWCQIAKEEAEAL